MNISALPAAALSWLGRQGTRAVASLVVIGICVPWIGAALKAWVPYAVFVLLCVAFLRVDVRALKSYLARPAIVAIATLWTSVAVPLLVGAIALGARVDKRAPELFLGLMLQGIASPMMAAPALATLLGLDATLSLVTLIASTVLLPLTAPIWASVFLGAAKFPMTPLVLSGRLLALLGAAGVVGLALRRVVGKAVIDRSKDAINGVNILVLFVFVAAVMDGVAGQAVREPGAALALTSLAFAVFVAILVVTVFVFSGLGRERALALGLMTSQRNMGLMLAVTGGVLPRGTWLYFALAQFPIYLAPELLRALMRRSVSR